MNTKEESLKSVQLDKLGCQHYLTNYSEYLNPLQDQEFTLFELGIAEGKSLLYWQDKFPKAQIIGLDINLVQLNAPAPRIKIYQGEQQDFQLLDRIATEAAPKGFDIIIDDASHLGQYTRLCFWHLFQHYLKPGGLYFIEDWGTGYWDIYSDGKKYVPKAVDFTWLEKILNSLLKNSLVQKTDLLSKIINKLRLKLIKNKFPSHQYGMVGFIKELVDECGVADMTDPRFGNPPQRSSMIEWMRVSVGHVIIKKTDKQLT